MLALYRSDRQAEALQTYQLGRQALAEELGLTPSPGLQRLEQQILEHDPALTAPAAPRSPDSRRRVRWPLVALVALVALVVAAAVAATVAELAPDEGAAAREATSLEEGGVGALDPATGELESAIPLGSAPANVAVGEGGVWVLDADDRTISRIDPSDHVLLRTFSTGSTPSSLAAGAGALWVGSGTDESSYPERILRLDPESGVEDAAIPLPGSNVHSYFQGGGIDQQLIAVADDAVWAINPDQTVSRIDPRTNRVVARVTGVRATSVAAGEAGVWVVDTDPVSDKSPRVAEIDPETNTIARRIEVAAAGLASLALGAGAVWIADPVGGSVWRLDPDRQQHLLRTIPLGVGVRWVAFGEGAVWATNDAADTVHRIDPRTNRARTVGRVAAPSGAAVGDGGVWISSAGRPSTDATLPASACRDVHYGGPGGGPRFLLVSDLPLQGSSRAFTRPMVDGIRFVLERRGFRAGPYTVGYQSCDDATALAGGFDFNRCLSNAKAYARTPDVIGVIGTFNYGCSEVQIPIANQAPDGPLGMISPSNTPPHLTRPGWSPDAPESLYPEGTRNFVRIAAADHLQAPALVEAAKAIGSERLVTLWDGDDDPYGARFVAEMRKHAQTLDLELAAAAPWSSRAQGFDRLARRVAATRPDAVLLAGAAPPYVRALLRDLREHLGRRVALVASDGFFGVSGPSAQGMYFGNYGVPNARLPTEGRQFLADLKAAGGTPGPDFSAAYGAQAAEIMLDAIARSDGTRASVTRELLRTQVEDGILGDIRFDGYGDLTEGPITIFRVVGRRAVVDRVITIRAAPRGR